MQGLLERLGKAKGYIERREYEKKAETISSILANSGLMVSWVEAASASWLESAIKLASTIFFMFYKPFSYT